MIDIQFVICFVCDLSFLSCMCSCVMSSTPKCLIFGHCFIKRLAEKQVADPWIFKTNLGLEQCSVTLKGFGGLNFGLKNSRVKQKFYAIVDNVLKCNNYDFVLCQLGSNEVSSYISPSALRGTFADFTLYTCETYYGKIRLYLFCYHQTRTAIHLAKRV